MRHLLPHHLYRSRDRGAHRCGQSAPRRSRARTRSSTPTSSPEPEVADPVPVGVTECLQADAEGGRIPARVRVQDLDAVRPADPRASWRNRFLQPRSAFRSAGGRTGHGARSLSSAGRGGRTPIASAWAIQPRPGAGSSHALPERSRPCASLPGPAARPPSSRRRARCRPRGARGRRRGLARVARRGMLACVMVGASRRAIRRRRGIPRA